MKRVIISILLAAVSLGANATQVIVTNTSDKVEVKGWKRHYVYGTADGQLIDPSGKIASYAAGAAEGAITRQLSEIADTARLTASNNLARMYSVTNLISTFTKKIFVKAHLYPDITQLSNCWGRVVTEWTDGTNDHCLVYFSRELNVAPKMKRVYTSETATNWVDGVWTAPVFTNQSVIVDGYVGCKELVYTRPPDHYMQNCFNKPYLNFGTEANGFDFGTRVFTLDDQLGITCAVTNKVDTNTYKIWWFNNGVKVRDQIDVD